jgi:hypothetical protein
VADAHLQKLPPCTVSATAHVHADRAVRCTLAHRVQSLCVDSTCMHCMTLALLRTTGI